MLSQSGATTVALSAKINAAAHTGNVADNLSAFKFLKSVVKTTGSEATMVVVVAIAPTVDAKQREAIETHWHQSLEYYKNQTWVKKEDLGTLSKIKLAVCSAEELLQVGAPLIESSTRLLRPGAAQWPILDRDVDVAIELKRNPQRVILLGGRRRIGKSTLVASCCPKAVFVDLSVRSETRSEAVDSKSEDISLS
jgi:hypothetical protein